MTEEMANRLAARLCRYAQCLAGRIRALSAVLFLEEVEQSATWYELVNRFEPGPMIVRCLSLIASGVLAVPIVIVRGTLNKSGSNTTVSPLAAEVIAWRNEPAPVSLALVTVRMAAWAAPAPIRIAVAMRRHEYATDRFLAVIMV